MPNAEVRHCGPLKAHPLNEYELPLADYRPGNGQTIIYDRHYLGELIYGPIYRNTSALDDASTLHVELFLKSRGAVMVSLLHDKVTIAQRLNDRGETFLQPEHVDRVIGSYRFMRHVVSLTSVNHDGDVTDGLIDDVLAAAEFEEAMCAELSWFRTYVGSPVPEILLLGETRGPTSPLATGRHPSAFTPFSGSSGHYLLSALAQTRHALGIANALEDDVHALWQVLGCPKVVALGKAAQVECARAGVPHGSVPHPSWARRFHYSLRPVYAKAIIDAASYERDLSTWPN